MYEWTESRLLPSEWNERVETNQVVTGTALYGNDEQYTAKQIYDSKLDRFVNIYYYWVKGKTTLPPPPVGDRHRHRAGHRINTVAYVANLIANPSAFDIKYYAVTDTNKLQIYNVNDLVGDDIVLNVDIRTNDFDGDAHSVWKLAREGDADFKPGSVVETRWWDSLIGSNSTGDIVPDPNSPINERYGNNTRPRQSWYVDRYSALKEIIDYANTVLKKNQLSGTINLSNLDKKEPEPTQQSGEWDATVDTYAELTYLNTAELSGSVRYLVKADETANNYWAIYTWDGTEFTRTKLQTYNTSAYWSYTCLLYTSPSPRDRYGSRMPSSA